MRQYGKRKRLWILIGLVLVAGCATSPRAVPEGGSVNIADTNMAKAMNAAETALSQMHFVVEKADGEQGIIRTKPLPGAQFFEFWRSDNVGPAQTAEASLHTLRRSVEIQLQPVGYTVQIHCTVHVERLSLPANEVASVSQVYRMHSPSSPTIQRLELGQEQQESMAWIDLGEDPALADRILKQIILRIDHQEKDETT